MAKQDEGSTTGEGLSDFERTAIKERAAELRAQSRGGSKTGKAERDREAVLAAIAEMPDADRAIAERFHAIVAEQAPELLPKTWYGMPAYARDGRVVCFFQAAAKFQARYATIGFDQAAELDDGALWPVSFAVVELTEAGAAQIAELVRRAVG